MKRHALLRGAATLGFLSLLNVSALAQVSITPIFTNPAAAPSPLAAADIIAAFNRLSSYFYSPTPFNMTSNITFFDAGTGGLGGSVNGSTSFQNEGGFLYANPLDRYLFGDKPGLTGPATPGYVDFNILINNNPAITYDYTLGTPPANEISLADVIYHEAMHSMGFLSLTNADGTPTFGTPTIWTTFMTDGAGHPFLSLTDAQRAQAEIGGDGALLFAGPNAEAAHGGAPVLLYAPNPFEPGSSDGSHISFSEPEGGVLYSGLSYGDYFDPTPLNLAMLQDIGWRLTSAAVPEPGSIALLTCLSLTGAAFLRRRKQSRNAV